MRVRWSVPTVGWTITLAAVLVSLLLSSGGTGYASDVAPSPGAPQAAQNAPGASGLTGSAAGNPVNTSAPHPWSCHGVRFLGTAACAGALPTPPASPLVASSPGWTPVQISPPPQALYDFEMTYDAADGYVVLLGSIAGSGGSEGPTDLWTFAGGNWTSRTPALLPMNCPGSVLAYDDTDREVVYFGGPNFGGSGLPTCTSANETWTYHGGVWAQLTPTTSPPGRYGASFTNDSADGYLLLFGGESGWCTPYGWCDDTWKFSGGNWTQLSPAISPSNRGEAGMAYDAKDGYVVLFGGTNTSGGLNDTWRFSAGNWTQLHPASSPPSPTPDAFSYDSADSEIVYTTAYNFSGPYSEITWTFQGGNWTHVTAPGPAERLGAGAADDPLDGYLLFFGGTGLTGLADSWTFHAGNWTNITPPSPGGRYSAAAAYDGATHTVELFGGTHYSSCCAESSNDTWSFNGTRWSPVTASTAPPPRAVASLVYDSADGYLLLFGGYGGTTGSYNDTWEFAGGVWTQLTPTASPPRGFGGTAVYDGADGYVLLLLGSPGSMWTWSFHAGVWKNITSSAGAPPPGPALNPLVYDSTDGIVLLFGTVNRAGSGFVLSNETWSFHGGRWTNLTATAGPAPPAVGSAALADFPPGGYVLLYEGTGTDDTWTFANGTWSPLFVPAGPSPRWGTADAYDPALSAAVVFGGSSTACGGLGYTCADTWLWSLNGSPSPVIRTFTATPSTVDLGQTFNLTVTTLGGVGPLSFSYAGLPSGCGSANTSRLACTPTATGGFVVEVKVTDSALDVVTATTTVTVNTALVVSSLSAGPSNLTLGASTLLTTSVMGGTSPFSYQYTGLPPGCSTQTVPALPCTPTAAGNYTVAVRVTDAPGGMASGSASLTVRPVGGAAGPEIYGFAAVPPAIVLGNTTNLSVDARGGVSPLTYLYAGLPAGCLAANVSTLPCTPTSAGTFTVTVSVEDSTHASAAVTSNLTVYPVGGGAGLTVTAFAATPGSVLVGQSTIIQVLASGGVGPIGYSYWGLPPGCATYNASFLPCQPTAPGNYSIHVTAFDAAGDSAGVRAGLTVTPAGTGVAPSISTFLVTPSAVVVGTTVTILVSVAAGTLPITYVYSGLPSGCTSVNAPIVQCVPTQPGNFTVTVRVTDALGRSVTDSARLSVAPAQVVPPPGSSSSSGSLLESPAALLGLAVLGGLVALVVAALWERRRTRRREGEALVRELETQPIDVGPDEPGA